MLKKRLLSDLVILLSLFLSASYVYAQDDDDGMGQTVQIYTYLHSFVGKPSWLLIIRDLDHNQNIPYLFDMTKGDNYWVAPTYSRNYLITVSNLQMETYRSRYNTFKLYTIPNFCHLESNGRIIRGESIYVTIQGDLSPNTSSYDCHIAKYADSHFRMQ